MDAERFARQIALPEIGPDGQARLGAARVAVIGGGIAASTAASYLRAAGVGEVDERAELGPLDGLQLVVRSGFDDDALLPAARRLGLPVIVMRASGDVVDVLSFPGRAADATPASDGPGSRLDFGTLGGSRAPRDGVAPAEPSRPPRDFKSAAPADDGAAGVLAGTIAAAEALHALIAEPGATTVKHLRLPLDGREPLRQEIPAR